MKKMKDDRNFLFTIGIPTYNQLELFHSPLLSLVPQIRAYSDEVDLIVSNNNSEDITEEVLVWTQQYGPIWYHRNPLSWFKLCFSPGCLFDRFTKGGSHFE